jgi:hypothetical protein
LPHLVLQSLLLLLMRLKLNNLQLPFDALLLLLRQLQLNIRQKRWLLLLLAAVAQRLLLLGRQSRSHCGVETLLLLLLLVHLVGDLKENYEKMVFLMAFLKIKIS